MPGKLQPCLYLTTCRDLFTDALALISKDLPLESSGHILKRFAVVSASIRHPEGHDLAVVIDARRWSLKPKNQPMVVGPRLAIPWKTLFRLMGALWQTASLVLSAKVDAGPLPTEIMQQQVNRSNGSSSRRLQAHKPAMAGEFSEAVPILL